jgi:hypothetical protein
LQLTKQLEQSQQELAALQQQSQQALAALQQQSQQELAAVRDQLAQVLNQLIVQDFRSGFCVFAVM